MMVKEYKIRQLSSDNYEIEKASKITLCLFKDYMTYSSWSHGSYLDDKMETWGPRKFNNKAFTLKENVTAIECNYLCTREQWSVKVFVVGSTNDLYFEFKDESEANTFYNELINWKINKE